MSAAEADGNSGLKACNQTEAGTGTSPCPCAIRVLGSLLLTGRVYKHDAYDIVYKISLAGIDDDARVCEDAGDEVCPGDADQPEPLARTFLRIQL